LTEVGRWPGILKKMDMSVVAAFPTYTAARGMSLCGRFLSSSGIAVIGEEPALTDPGHSGRNSQCFLMND